MQMILQSREEEIEKNKRRFLEFDVANVKIREQDERILYLSREIEKYNQLLRQREQEINEMSVQMASLS